jgi:molecular chaperone HscB
VNLSASDFELFGLVPRFSQNQAMLDARWKELQREVHPDKFVAQGAAAQRLAMQWSVRINEAYQRLKDPLKRAAYLCELNTAAVNAESNTAMPADFLLQQMQWREDLEDASKPEDIDKIRLDVMQNKEILLQKCEHLLDVKQDYVQAVAQVRALMFMQKFLQDIDSRLETIN